MSEIQYSRRLSLWQVMARGLGVMVYLVIFVLMGDTVATAGPLAPLVFLLAAVLMLVNTLGYVELVTSFPDSNTRARRFPRRGGVRPGPRD
ncbi:MAG: hypothetical protein PVG71_00135 [Anaerolineae bacterium]|jgi:amino acid transporter